MFVAGQVGSSGGRGSRFAVAWNEDAHATVYARITDPDGSGGPTGIRGEGNWIAPPQVASIICEVFDLDGGSPDAPILSPAVPSSAVTFPKTDGWIVDNVGFNFTHRLPPESFPEGGRRYEVQYKVTTTTGRVFHGSYRGPARSVVGS